MNNFFQFHGPLFFDSQGQSPIFVPILEYSEISPAFLPAILQESGDATSIQWYSGKVKITKYIDTRFIPFAKRLCP